MGFISSESKVKAIICKSLFFFFQSHISHHLLISSDNIIEKLSTRKLFPVEDDVGFCTCGFLRKARFVPVVPNETLPPSVGSHSQVPGRPCQAQQIA